ncbi:MAG: hypothetical protein R3D31_15755 [Hyphomicrobiaceae bacterium]
MKLPSQKAMILNGAAIMVVLGGAASLLRSVFDPDQTPPCSTTYTRGTLFGLEKAPGVLLTAVDLQTRLDYSEWGVVENVRIVPTKDGPAPAALRVAIPKGSINPKNATAPKGGMGFRWRPSSVPTGTTAACLAYSIQLPEGFEFNKGGKLPGLFGGDAPAGGKPVDGKAGFSARFMWRAKGDGEVYAYVPGAPAGRGLSIDRGKFAFPRGKWVRLEQEIVLNKPGASDGILRVWVDGRLKIEKTDMTFRTTDTFAVTGVMADIFYGGKTSDWAAPKDTHVMLSPFELRWR